MIVTLYRGAKQPIPERADDFTWDEFEIALAELVQDVSGAAPKANQKAQKAALLAFSPVELSKPYRLAANVKAITLLVLDVDGFTLEPVIESIQALGIAAIVYGSPSDDRNFPEARRFRVIAPITRPIDPADSARTRYGFAELLGIPPGVGVEGATSPEKIFFVGRIHVPQFASEREFLTFDGAPVDVDAILAEPLTHAWGTPKASAPLPSAGRTAGSLAHAEAIALQRPAAVDGVEGGKVTLITAIEIGKVTRDEAATLDVLTRIYNPRCLPPWSEAELAHKARDAHKKIEEQENDPVFKMQMRLDAAREMGVSVSERDAGTAPLAPLDCDKKGDPRPTISNAEIVLASTLEGRIRWDEHRRRIVVAGVDPVIARLPDGPWKDSYTTEVRALFETFGLRMRKSDVADAVSRHAERRRFNPVRDYAEQCALAWDGVPRVDEAMARYWHASAPYASIVSRIWFLSLAARMWEPGCKVHTVLVLHSDEQYIGKSSSLEALVPVKEWYADSALPIGEKDGMSNLAGKVIWEIGEGASASKKDAETLKQFFASSQDSYRGAYQQFSEDCARSCVFTITTNRTDILRDATGERRFMTLSLCDQIDVAGIARDRDQLIGEAVARVVGRDEQWWLTREEVAALAPGNDQISEQDPWQDVIGAWLVRKGYANDALHKDAVDALHSEKLTWRELTDLSGGAIPMLAHEVGQREHKRICSCLRRLGWVSVAVNGERYFKKL